MTQKQNELQIKAHPIHLTSVAIKELCIKSNQVPDINIGLDDGGKFDLLVGHSEYDKDNKSIVVSLALEIGQKEEETKVPFSMRIEIVGHFKVDESNFPVEHILHWAKNNAPFVLMPYLREQAYSLSSKGGYRPILLPLTEVSTFILPKN